jgi:hypothetical protein
VRDPRRASPRACGRARAGELGELISTLMHDSLSEPDGTDRQRVYDAVEKCSGSFRRWVGVAANPAKRGLLVSDRPRRCCQADSTHAGLQNCAVISPRDATGV